MLAWQFLDPRHLNSALAVLPVHAPHQMWQPTEPSLKYDEAQRWIAVEHTIQNKTDDFRHHRRRQKRVALDIMQPHAERPLGQDRMMERNDQAVALGGLKNRAAHWGAAGDVVADGQHNLLDLRVIVHPINLPSGSFRIARINLDAADKPLVFRQPMLGGLNRI